MNPIKDLFKAHYDFYKDRFTDERTKYALLGGFWLLVGVTYLTAAAFKKGALAYEEAELKALIDAGLATELNETK